MKNEDFNGRRIWASLLVILATVILLAVTSVGTAAVSGCGHVGQDTVLPDASGDGDDATDEVAVAASSRGPSSVIHGEGYRPPSLPPVIDHPSFIVMASPSFDEHNPGAAADGPRILSIDGKIISQLTGLPVAREPVTAVQIRMVGIPAAKTLRVMKESAVQNTLPVEVEVQHDVTDSEGNYLFIFENFECGDEIWIASPSSNTLVLQPCSDILLPASDAEGDSNTFTASSTPPDTTIHDSGATAPAAPTAPAPPAAAPTTSGAGTGSTSTQTAQQSPAPSPPPPSTTTATAPATPIPTPATTSTDAATGTVASPVATSSSGDTVTTATLIGTRSTVTVVVATTVQDILSTLGSKVELVVGTKAGQGMVVAIGGAQQADGKTSSTTIAASPVKNGQSSVAALIGAGSNMASVAKNIYVKVDRIGDILKTSYSTTGKVGSYIGIASQKFAKETLGKSVGVTVTTHGRVATGSVQVTTSSPLNR